MLRSIIHRTLYPFGVLSESIDELIDNKVVWDKLPKKVQKLLWRIDLRSGNLHHMSELDNWGSHEPFNTICCKLGRHDYYSVTLYSNDNLPGYVGIKQECFRCGATKLSNIIKPGIANLTPRD